MGAFFEAAFLPSSILLCLALIPLITLAPWRLALENSRGARVLLGALTALGLWALLSAFWSPAPDTAVGDAQRILVYALLVGLGLGLANLLAPRLDLALGAVASVGLIAVAVTTLSLLWGESPVALFERDGTLDYPIDYRNANAAFFAILAFPAVALATEKGPHAALRVASLATATGCFALFYMCQSRASIPAVGVAALVYLLAHPLRLRALMWLGLAAAPAVIAIPAASDLYQAVNSQGLSNSVAEMNAAGMGVVTALGASVLVGILVLRFEGSLPGLGTTTPRANRGVALGLGALLVAGAIAFLIHVGDPIDWAGERIDEFTASSGTPDLSDRSSRFTFDIGSNRYDLWRVALDDFAEAPILGSGGGGFPFAYLLKRNTGSENVQDAHSVELEVLTELGLPGLTLLVIAILGAVFGLLRSRRLGRNAATATAVGLAAGAYWLLHASVDWFWPYPGVTGPVMALIGIGCAPAAMGIAAPSRRNAVLVAVVPLAVALSAVPLYLSERFVIRATDIWRVDGEQAYADLEQARAFNPLSDWPYLIEGEIAIELDDRERAIAAFTAAVEQRPEQWAGRYRLAELLAESDPPRAREAVRGALSVNPLDPKVRSLARRLGVATPPQPAD